MLNKISMIITFCFILLAIVSCDLFDNSLNLNVPKWISYSNPTPLDDDNDANARIYVVNAPMSNVYVNLLYTDNGEGLITIPASVIIKKSTTSTTFKIECLEATVPDSPVWVVITATAKGYTAAEDVGAYT